MPRRFLFVMLFLFSSVWALASDPAQIPVENFFKHAEFDDVVISPGGDYLLATAPRKDRTVIAVLKTSDKSVLTTIDYGEDRHPVNYMWVSDDRFVTQIQKKFDAADFRVFQDRLFASNADGSKRKVLSGGQKQELEFNEVSGIFYDPVDPLIDDPKFLMVRMYKYGIEHPLLQKMNVLNGRTTNVTSHPLKNGGFLLDSKGKVRLASGVTDDLQDQVWMLAGTSDWSLVHDMRENGADWTLLGFEPQDREVYVQQSFPDGLTRVALWNPATKDEKVLFESRSDSVSDVIYNARGNDVLGVVTMPGVYEKHYFDPGHPETQLHQMLDQAFPGKTVRITSQTRDGSKAIVRVTSDRDPGSVYLFDTVNSKASFILAFRNWIKPKEMAPREPFEIKARDGETLRGFLTRPEADPREPLPMIVIPHGGPIGPRDTWSFDPDAQLFANRGYAVLQVNFRGSGGYGLRFRNLGFGQWGTGMIDDITDAVRWAVKSGHVDGSRICIAGSSYGGYAAMQSVIREPDLYRCAVGVVGVYSLPLLKSTNAAEQSQVGKSFDDKMLGTDEEVLRRDSPAYNVDRIKVPLMLAHGRLDHIVDVNQYNLFRDKLKEAGKEPEVTILEKKESHGFESAENQTRLYTEMLKFFDRHIGKKAPQSTP